MKKETFLLANLFFLISLIIFFYRPIFSNKLPIPADTLQEYQFFKVDGLSDKPQNKFMYDVFVDFVPWFHFDIKELRHGDMPLWDPYQACGVPHIANMQSAFFFLLNIFVYLLGLKWGLLLLYIMKLYFAGVFLYLYLCKIEIDYRVSIIASIAFMYSGFNTGFLYWPHTNLSFYVPLGLLATELILKEPDRLKGYMLLCLGVSTAIFGGHPEMLFYESSIILIYFIFRALKEYRFSRATKKIFLKTIIFLFIGIIISSVQLIPFIEYLYYSYTYWVRSNASNNYYLPAFIGSLSIIPDFLNMFLRSDIINVFGGILPIAMGYTGITITLFFLTGVFELYKNKYILPYIVILGYIIIVAFNFPILHHLITILPLFRVSWNSFMLGCAPLFMIMIAANAIDEIYVHKLKFNIKYPFFVLSLIIAATLIVLLLSINKHIDPFILKQFYFITIVDVLITIFFLLCTIILINLKNKAYIYFLLGSIVFIQTAIPMIPFEPAIKPEYMYPENNIIKVLKEQPKPFRVFPLTYTKEQKPAWPVDIATYYDIEDLRNYDVLGIRWYEILFRTMPQMDFLNLVNVKYIVMSSAGFTSPTLQKIISANGYTLYKNPSALDRAFMVYDYKIANTGEEWLKLIDQYATQLGNLAIISKKDADLISPDYSANNKAYMDIKFITYKPGYIKMHVYTSKPGLLIITNTYFPGWHAYVDDREINIIRTDFAFDGIHLKDGTHTVILTYSPLSFIIGSYLSLIGLVTLSIIYFYSFKK